MPATVEELQGVVAGLSEIVKGLVNTVQQQSALLQAHTTASTSQANSADTTSDSNNQHLSTLRLLTLQLPTFRHIKPHKMILPNFWAFPRTNISPSRQNSLVAPGTTGRR